MARKTILVVEDEPDITMLIRRSLDLKKFKILEAESGMKAFEILVTAKPDLILMDIMMPDIDGFEICRQIKQKSELKHIPVVFLTVRNNDEDIVRGREAGAVGYFTKPFDPFKLSEDIERLML